MERHACTRFACSTTHRTDRHSFDTLYMWLCWRASFSWRYVSCASTSWYISSFRCCMCLNCSSLALNWLSVSCFDVTRQRDIYNRFDAACSVTMPVSNPLSSGIYITRYRCEWMSHADELSEPLFDQRLHICRCGRIHPGTGAAVVWCSPRNVSICMLTSSTAILHKPSGRHASAICPEHVWRHACLRSKRPRSDQVLTGFFALRPMRQLPCQPFCQLQCSSKRLGDHDDVPATGCTSSRTA